MSKNTISGQRQMDFVSKFNYIREAGTPTEEKAASLIQAELKSFGMESRIEEFPLMPGGSERQSLPLQSPIIKPIR